MDGEEDCIGTEYAVEEEDEEKDEEEEEDKDEDADKLETRAGEGRGISRPGTGAETPEGRLTVTDEVEEEEEANVEEEGEAVGNEAKELSEAGEGKIVESEGCSA